MRTDTLPQGIGHVIMYVKAKTMEHKTNLRQFID